MRIRSFRAGDAPALARLYHDAVHRIGALHYSSAQVEAWSPEAPDPQGFVRKAGDGRILLVAADEADKPIAYGDLEPDGHLDHLYCRPDAAGTGVASALYDRLEAAARELGIGRLFVEASEPARRFFLRKGFVVVRRHDFTLRGVAIHNFAMAKELEE